MGEDSLRARTKLVKVELKQQDLLCYWFYIIF